MKQDPTLEQDFIAPVREFLEAEYLGESHVLNLLPVAVYVCDASGRITNYNKKAVELWGRTPRKDDDEERFCGAFKLYYPDGRYMPHSETPVAACLKNGQPYKDEEVIIERPDLSRIVVRVNIAPIKDEQGTVLGMVNSFYNITDQKQKQKELDWKTRQLQDYVDNAAICLHWVDENGVIKWANKAELDMLGYSEEEYIGHHISEFHVDETRIKDILNRLGCNETLQGYESTLRCKDGSLKNVQISSNVFWDEGKFVHTRCFTIDVTEQRNLFQALQTSESRYRKLVQSLETPLYTTDQEGRITLFNKAAADLWGREPEIGKDLWCGSYKIFNTDGTDLPLDECPMAVCLKEQRPVYGKEILVVRSDGTLRNVAPHPQPIFDESGNMTGAINMLIDITDMKRTGLALSESEAKYRELAASLEEKVEEKTQDLKRKNEELRKSEERYHKMIDEVEDYAIILLDKNGIVQNWNKGAEKIKGYKEKEIVGKSFETFYLEEDRKDKLPHKLISQARDQGKAIHEGWRLRKDGTMFWGSIVLTALHDDENNIIGFSKVTRDLTNRKLAEDKLREYTSQLEFQNKELEQFAYAASHDMKEPLRKIHFYNSYIFDNTSNQLDQKSKEYLDRSINAVRRMSNLIEDLLTYSKTTSGADGFEAVDLNGVVNEILLHHREEFEQKKISISLGRLPVIQAIPFQLKQILDNLINNSIKYKHPDRDVMIRITSELVSGSQIQNKSAEADKQYHKISVEDNGIGFDPQYAEKIFEVFQRLNNLPGAKGSGIGLAICKKIMQNHKGFIKATGRENTGACFDIYIPAAL
ncbi:MAG TPA: PAS domain S-box protein [Flavisolibacter sp.]|jgi:PAS domain S-box-containing protein